MAKSTKEAELAGISVFSELSKKELKAISKLMTLVEFPAGRVLTQQGAPGREFMVISDGTANVDVDGVIVAHLSAGDFLGELAIISGAPRTATVTATSDLTAEVLNRREFMALLDESTNVAKKILVGAVKRLQENESTKTN